MSGNEKNFEVFVFNANLDTVVINRFFETKFFSNQLKANFKKAQNKWFFSIITQKILLHSSYEIELSENVKTLVKEYKGCDQCRPQFSTELFSAEFIDLCNAFFCF